MGLQCAGEDESWDFGSGAGFYLNATQAKWKQYRMYDYITKELPEVLGQFSELDTSNVSRARHRCSMLSVCQPVVLTFVLEVLGSECLIM